MHIPIISYIPTHLPTPYSHTAPKLQKIQPQIKQDQRLRPRKPGIRRSPQIPCVDCRRGTACPDGTSNPPRPARPVHSNTRPANSLKFTAPTRGAWVRHRFAMRRRRRRRSGAPRSSRPEGRRLRPGGVDPRGAGAGRTRQKPAGAAPDRAGRMADHAGQARRHACATPLGYCTFIFSSISLEPSRNDGVRLFPGLQSTRPVRRSPSVPAFTHPAVHRQSCITSNVVQGVQGICLAIDLAYDALHAPFTSPTSSCLACYLSRRLPRLQGVHDLRVAYGIHYLAWLDALQKQLPVFGLPLYLAAARLMIRRRRRPRNLPARLKAG